MNDKYDSSDFLNKLYGYYLARKGKKLNIETIKDDIVVSEYKPISARVLQREGRDYTSFIVSPFKPGAIREAKTKKNNPLVLESSIEKPKIGFSLFEWVKQVQSNKVASYHASKFIDKNGNMLDDEAYFNLINIGYILKDENLNEIENDLEEVIGRLNVDDTDGDGEKSINEIFEQHKVDLNAAEENVKSPFTEPLIGLNEEGEEVLLIDDLFFKQKEIKSLRDLEDIFFTYSGLINASIAGFDIEGGSETNRNRFNSTTPGYHREHGRLNQYSLNLRAVFLLKNKDFYSLDESSDVNLIFNASLNKQYKENILNLNSDNSLFTVKNFNLLDDRVTDETIDKSEITQDLNLFFTKSKNLHKIGFPIVDPDILKNIKLINNYELINNYLTEYTFTTNPINLIDFDSVEYKKISFSQQELVNASYRNLEGAILNPGPSIFNEDSNDFKSILKKYLIFEQDNLSSYSDHHRVSPPKDPIESNSIYYVLINLLWEKIMPLLERGVIIRTNFSIETSIRIIKNHDDSDLMLKYSKQLLYLVKDPDEGDNYYTNFSGPEGIEEFSFNKLKTTFFNTLYDAIISFFEEFEYSVAFETFLEISDYLIPDISIVYAEDDITLTQLPEASDLSERTQWSTVVDFARNENMKNNSSNANDVIKLKDFLNKLSTKIEELIVLKEKEKDPVYKEIVKNIKSIGNYNIDFLPLATDPNSTRLWRVKDQYGKIINDYFDIAMPLILTEFHIVNAKKLSKFKTRQKCLKTLSKVKEDESFKNIKEGFSIIRNSIPSIIELFNRFYNPNYFVNKAFRQRNSKEIKDKLEVTRSSLENLIGKTAIVKVNGKVGIIYNFDPLICYKADSALSTIGLREQQAGNQFVSIDVDYGKIYPILYPYSRVSTDSINEVNDEVRRFHPNLLGFYNLWDIASTTESTEIKKKHISFPGYYEESQNKFSGYNFKNMPVLSAGIYSRHAMVAPENPEKRTVIDNFYIINDPSEFSPRESTPRLTEIFYERYHTNRSFKVELKSTGNPSLIKELKKEDLKNKADLVLGTPVFFLSDKSESENGEYFTNKEFFVDLDKIEAIYFFDKKDYNPHTKAVKYSKNNTTFSLRGKK